MKAPTEVRGGQRAALTPRCRAALDRRARRLAAVTIIYNTGEGAVAVVAGSLAGSIGLVGLGLDSAVEVLSALAIGWQFHGRVDARERERERVALRLIAVAFFALSAYVVIEALAGLIGGREAWPSPVGIGLAAASLLVMPVLARVKRRVGRELGSASVGVDAVQTELCAYLSAVLLVGLVLNAALGWSWADPLAGIGIAVLAAREGLQAWRERSCCPSTQPLAIEEPERAAVTCCPR